MIITYFFLVALQFGCSSTADARLKERIVQGTVANAEAVLNEPTFPEQYQSQLDALIGQVTTLDGSTVPSGIRYILPDRLDDHLTEILRVSETPKLVYSGAVTSTSKLGVLLSFDSAVKAIYEVRLEKLSDIDLTAQAQRQCAERVAALAQAAGPEKTIIWITGIAIYRLSYKQFLTAGSSVTGVSTVNIGGSTLYEQSESFDSLRLVPKFKPVSSADAAARLVSAIDAESSAAGSANRDSQQSALSQLVAQEAVNRAMEAPTLTLEKARELFKTWARP